MSEGRELRCIGDGTNVGEMDKLMGAMLTELFGVPVFSLTVQKRDVESVQKYPDNVKFSYYGCTGECNRHSGVIVVASRINNEMVEYGVAYCSPKDVYDKYIGKKIAYRDLVEESKMVVLNGKKHHKINARILADVVANADCPSWADKKIAIELVRHLFYAFDLENV